MNTFPTRLLGRINDRVIRIHVVREVVFCLLHVWGNIPSNDFGDGRTAFLFTFLLFERVKRLFGDDRITFPSFTTSDAWTSIRRHVAVFIYSMCSQTALNGRFAPGDNCNRYTAFSCRGYSIDFPFWKLPGSLAVSGGQMCGNMVSKRDLSHTKRIWLVIAFKVDGCRFLSR